METVNNVNETANIRKLATIARISKIEEIEGANSLELAHVRGWRVVVQKGQFQSGSLCVYIEVDSVLPDGLPVILQIEWRELHKALSKANTDSEKDAIKLRMAEISKLNTRPEFEFLREKKFRIKTREVFQTLSQGICFPLSILPMELQWHINELETSRLMPALGRVDTVEDMDVTDILGVTQYVAPENTSLEGIALGDLGSVGVLISDEERCENIIDRYEKLRQFRYVKSEKLEGTSILFYIKNNEFGVCGRNINYKRPEGNERVNSFWSTAIKMGIEAKMRKYGIDNGIPNFAIQGELVGEGIQGNIYKLIGKTVRFYNAYDIDSSQYYEYLVFIDMIKEMGLETVPILDLNFELPENPDDLLIAADNARTVFGNNPNQLAEGHVFVAIGDVRKNRILRSTFNRLSFKAKSREYDKRKG